MACSLALYRHVGGPFLSLSPENGSLLYFTFISDIFRCDKSPHWATWVYLLHSATIESESLNGPKTVAFTIVPFYMSSEIWILQNFNRFQLTPIVANKFGGNSSFLCYSNVTWALVKNDRVCGSLASPRLDIIEVIEKFLTENAILKLLYPIRTM